MLKKIILFTLFEFWKFQPPYSYTVYIVKRKILHATDSFRANDFESKSEN